MVGFDGEAELERMDSPGQQNNELQKIHRLLRGRYVWAIVLALVGAAAGGYGGFRLGKKTYQSAGQIRVIPVLPKIIYNVDEKGTLPMFEEYVLTQAARLGTPDVLQSAAEDQRWKPVWSGRPDELVLGLKDRIQVGRQGALISVTAIDPDPRVAALSVQTLIEAYRKEHHEKEVLSDQGRSQVLNKREAFLENELSIRRQRIQKIAQGHGTEDLKSKYEFQLQEYNKLKTSAREAQLAIAGAEGQHPTEARPGREPTVDELASRDPRLYRFLEDKLGWEQKIAALRAQKVLENHRELRTAEAMLKVADTMANGRAAELRKRRQDEDLVSVPEAPGASEMTMSVDQWQARLNALDELQKESKVALDSLGQQMLQINELKEEAEEIRTKLQQTRQRIEQLSVESATGGRIEILDGGSQALAPYKDTRLTFGGAGGMGGAFLGFGLILAIGLLDRRLRSPDDARSEICNGRDNPLLGILPILPDDLADPQRAAMAAHCVHEIRTLLQIRAGRKGHQVFAVTSPMSGTGKTSLTLALGVSFAAAHLKTLLIDCDLVGGGLTTRADAIARRKLGAALLRGGLVTRQQLDGALAEATRAHRGLGEVLVESGHLSEADLAQTAGTRLGESMGMLDAISGKPLPDCVTETQVPGLSILPLGAATAQHASRLSPSGLKKLIAAARERFDIVLIDTGPTPGSLEASLVASIADSVLLIVSRGDHRAVAERCVSHLTGVGARVAGLVFNRATDEDIVHSSSRRLSSSARPQSSNRSRVAAMFGDDDDEVIPLGPVATAVANRVPSMSGRKRDRK